MKTFDEFINESVYWDKADIIEILNAIGQDKVKFTATKTIGTSLGKYGTVEFYAKKEVQGMKDVLELVFKGSSPIEVEEYTERFHKKLNIPYIFHYFPQLYPKSIIVEFD